MTAGPAAASAIPVVSPAIGIGGTAGVSAAPGIGATAALIVRSAHHVIIRAKPPRPRSKEHEPRTRWSRAPSVLSPPQDLPVFRRKCAEDRLQGRPPAAAVRL